MTESDQIEHYGQRRAKQEPVNEGMVTLAFEILSVLTQNGWKYQKINEL